VSEYKAKDEPSPLRETARFLGGTTLRASGRARPRSGWSRVETDVREDSHAEFQGDRSHDHPGSPVSRRATARSSGCAEPWLPQAPCRARWRRSDRARPAEPGHGMIMLGSVRQEETEFGLL
jgi:hypothetical protein